MKNLLPIVGLWLGLLMAGGCQRSGRIVYERHEVRPDGSPLVQRVEVWTPTGPVVPGQLQFGSDGSLNASTGNEATVSQSAKSLAKLPYLGAGLLVLGALLLVLKAKLPFIPTEVGIGVAAVGLLLIILPSIIEAYLPYIVLGLLGTAVAVTIYRLNRIQVTHKNPNGPA